MFMLQGDSSAGHPGDPGSAGRRSPGQGWARPWWKKEKRTNHPSAVGEEIPGAGQQCRGGPEGSDEAGDPESERGALREGAWGAQVGARVVPARGSPGARPPYRSRGSIHDVWRVLWSM